MRKDKLKAMESANKRLLGETTEGHENLTNQMDRLKQIKNGMLNMNTEKPEQDNCKETAFKIWNHLTRQEWGDEGDSEENRNIFEEMWEWYSHNDNDYYEAGN